MLNIAICEDDEKDQKELEQLCQTISQREHVEGRFLLFASGEEVLACKDSIDLLILDIELAGVNGIEVKNKLQRLNKRTMIIFVTAHEEMMQSAFGLQVFGFVHKRYMEEQLAEMLPRAFWILQNYVKVEDVDSRKIVCIKAEHVYSRLFLEDGTQKLIRRTLGCLEELLGSVGFIRIHKSFLINASHVTGWHAGEVATAVGSYPISVRLRTPAKRQYDRYCMEHAKYCE